MGVPIASAASKIGQNLVSDRYSPWVCELMITECMPNWLTPRSISLAEACGSCGATESMPTKRVGWRRTAAAKMSLAWGMKPTAVSRAKICTPGEVMPITCTSMPDSSMCCKRTWSRSCKQRMMCCARSLGLLM